MQKVRAGGRETSPWPQRQHGIFFSFVALCKAQNVLQKKTTDVDELKWTGATQAQNRIIYTSKHEHYYLSKGQIFPIQLLYCDATYQKAGLIWAFSILKIKVNQDPNLRCHWKMMLIWSCLMNKQNQRNWGLLPLSLTERTISLTSTSEATHQV